MTTNAWELKTFPLSLLIQFGNENAFSKCLDNKCHKLCGDAPKLYLEGIHNFKCFPYFKKLMTAAYKLCSYWREKRIQEKNKNTETKIRAEIN